MELGQKIKQARLEAGLSQRQLCGEEITRNMLSLIENGSARPSMDTLGYLAARLGKTVAYFLEEQAVTSPNQALMEQARAAWTAGEPGRAMEVLADYREPDGVFDRERWLLDALCRLALAEQALREEKSAYAVSLLEQAAEAGAKTDYYSPALERQRLLLLYRARPASAQSLAAELPDWTEELLLRGRAALEDGDPNLCAAILDAGAPTEREEWHFLRAEAWLALKDYAQAAEHYRRAETAYPRQTALRLEQCYRELEDYKLAYFYACKQREE